AQRGQDGEEELVDLGGRCDGGSRSIHDEPEGLAAKAAHSVDVEAHEHGVGVSARVGVLEAGPAGADTRESLLREVPRVVMVAGEGKGKIQHPRQLGLDELSELRLVRAVHPEPPSIRSTLRTPQRLRLRKVTSSL